MSLLSRPSPSLLRVLLVVALAPVAASVRAGDPFAPEGPPASVAEQTDFEQRWGKVAVSPDGSRFAVAWSTVLFHDVFLRVFDADGTPLTGDVLVNATIKEADQDEPMLAVNEQGDWLVVFSDRPGGDGDGDGMGVFGRVFDPDGVPLGPEFQVSVASAQSQWEPMPAARPGGGWVVAFNGNDDGDAFARWFQRDGTPLTGDVTLATFDGNAQVDAAVAVGADGTALTAFVDFGAHVAPFTGTNVFVRRFGPGGAPLAPSEGLAHPFLLDGDQIEPRLAANRLVGVDARYVLVYEDAGNDGDGRGVFAVWFDGSGQIVRHAASVTSGPDGTGAAGDQVLPEVAMDHVGNSLITWEDRSLGAGRILGRWFDRDAKPLSPPFEVGAGSGGDARRPAVSVDGAGELALFAFDAPGDLPVSSQDVVVRRYTRRSLALPVVAPLGASTPLPLHVPSGAGLTYVVLASFGDAGIALPDGRSLALSLDPLFDLSLQLPDTGMPFVALQGVVDPFDEAVAGLVVPANPALIGVPLRFAALTLAPSGAGLEDRLRHVTGAATIVLD